jgi:competence protein ComEC
MLPITRLLIAWLAGIALADALTPDAGLPAALAALAALLLAILRQRAGASVPRTAVALLLSLALGALRLALDREDLGAGHAANANGQGAITVVGRVVTEPDRRDRGTDYRLRLESAAQLDADAPRRGLVLVQAHHHPPFAYGDLLQVHGALESPPVLEGFDYRAYLARQGIHSLIRRPRIARLAGGGAGWRHALIGLRHRGRRILAASLPEPEAALVTGILLGDDRGLPKPLADAFRASNTTHVIAISGSNIALLTGFLAATLGRLLGRRRAVPCILAILAAYTLLVGGDAAVVRAALMGGLTLLALRLGRGADAQAGLMTAAWLMTLWNPQALWDMGFQLSVAATVGLIRFAAPMVSACRTWLVGRFSATAARRMSDLAGEMLLVTLAAQLTTWPIIAHATGQVSVVGLLANALILPAQPAVMGLGALTLAAGLLWMPLGRLLGSLAWLPATWTVRVVSVLGDLPGASRDLPMPLVAVIAWYLGLAWFARPRTRRPGPGCWRALMDRRWFRAASGCLRAWRMRRQERKRPTEPQVATAAGLVIEGRARSIDERPAHGGEAGPTKPGARRGAGRDAGWRILRAASGWSAVALLAAAATLAWTAARARPDGLLHLHLLDIGQGDSLLLVSPNGRRLLIDGGPSGATLLAQMGRLQAPWDKHLDLVLLTHPDADHVGGLSELLRRYAVDAILDPELEAETPDAEEWRATLAERPVPRRRASAGGRIVLDEAAGVTGDILWPPEPRLTGVASPTNENAVVLRLTYGATSALFTGDIGADAEAALLARGAPLTADVLKLGHHGSAGSSTAPFLAAVRPRVALIGVGRDNRYGHPAPATLDRLATQGEVLLRRTDQDGAVELLSDGKGWWLP